MKPAPRALLATFAAAGLLATVPAFAQAPGADTSSAVHIAPGSVSTVHSVRSDATIVAIDATNRVVTLKNREGRVFDIIAGSEVRNFDQLRLGDKVKAEYTEAASMVLKKHGQVSRPEGETETLTRAAPGEKPGAVSAHTMTVLADVTAIDIKHKVVTLRSPSGKVVDITVSDPEQLKNIKKGDKVEATYTESFAIAVEPAQPAK